MNSSEDLIQNSEIPQPDSAWDYYEIWQSLHAIKNKIDAGLKLISGQELADNATDEKLKEILEPALEQLEEVVENYLTNFQTTISKPA